MADTVRRRRRPAVSCTLCRRRKIRCNRELPCSNCVRCGSEPCVYDPVPPSSAKTATSSSLRSARVADGVGYASSSSPTGPGPEVWTETVSGIKSLRPMLSPAATVSSSRQSVHAVETGNPCSSASSAPPSRAPSQWGGGDPLLADDPRREVIDEMSTRLAGRFHMVSDTGDTHTNDNLPYHQHEYQRQHPQPRSQYQSRKPAIPRVVTHKQRTFGQSHWITASLLFWDLIELMEPHLQSSQNNEATVSLRRCKTLARVIKARRAPAWPTVPSPDLPNRETADALVKCYMRTTERLYRIVHIPSFERDYNALWTTTHDPATGCYLSSSNPPSDKETAFLIQAKLILALGAVTYDKTFTLRPLATRYIYEARTWLSEPKFKARLLSLQSIQTEILLLLAEEQVDIAGDAVWVGAGALLRRAIHLGGHKDPKSLPRAGLLVTEMRRRLWNTILEINLQFAMSGGVPPGLMLEEFDTLPPGNYDDEDLVIGGEGAERPPKPEGVWTQTSLAIAMRRTFPVRLKAARALNNVRSTNATYDLTLKLDGELRGMYKELCATLQSHRRHRGAERGPLAAAAAGSSEGPSSFEVRAVDICMQRYLCYLHIPYIQASMQEKAYAYSRKAALEATVKVWYLVYPPPRASSSAKGISSRGGRPLAEHTDRANQEEQGEQEEQEEEQEDILQRFIINGSGFFRTTVAKVPVVVAKELRMQRAEESETGFHLPLRPDLLAVLDGSRAWHKATLESGETNMKGYLLAHGVAQYVDFMASGELPDLDAELVQVMLKAVRESIEESLPILEAEAAKYGPPVGEGGEGAEVSGLSDGGARDGISGGRGGVANNYGSGAMGGLSGNIDSTGWDTMMSNVTFDTMADADPMSWIISDERIEQEWLW